MSLLEVFLDLAPVISATILGVFGLLISRKYQRKNREIADDRMMKELFSEFNHRYNKLNDSLASLEKKNWTLPELEMEDNKKYKDDVIDFFNLCAEEYYWFTKGRIDPKVWKAWYSGMNYWVNQVKVIQELWLKEIKANGKTSYYLEGAEEFFRLTKPFQIQ